jgi:hypothetical protein
MIQLVLFHIAITFSAVRIAAVFRNVKQWLASKQKLFFRRLVLTSCCFSINLGTRTIDPARQHQGQEGGVEQSPIVWH